MNPTRSSWSISAQIEDGLEHSRVLVLCMSAEAFGSDWAQLESHTFRFKDPLNHDRRFIPLRLDNTPTKGSLAQFSYIDWRARQKVEYQKLRRACLSQQEASVHSSSCLEASSAAVNPTLYSMPARPERELSNLEKVTRLSWSRDGRLLASGSTSGLVMVHDVSTESTSGLAMIRDDWVECLSWSLDSKFLASSFADGHIAVWSRDAECEVLEFKAHRNGMALGVDWSSDAKQLISCSTSGDIGVWNAADGASIQTLRFHRDKVEKVAFSPNGNLFASCSWDKLVAIWREGGDQPIAVLAGHTDAVYSLAWSHDGSLLASASWDLTVRIWHVETGECVQVIEGHTDRLCWVSFSFDSKLLATSAKDHTVRIWRSSDWLEVGAIQQHAGRSTHSHFPSVVFSPSSYLLATVDLQRDSVNLWDLGPPEGDLNPARESSERAYYTNAKVILIGGSGAGKTALSNRIALNKFEVTDSTVGAWSTQWKLQNQDGDDVTLATIRRIESGTREPNAIDVDREVWLWDFGGQADQRLIHQLYIDQTQLAALVFDPQKDDVFETLGEWDRDLSRADKDQPAHDKMTKLLVAGRCDAGGLRVARSQIDNFVKERGYAGYYQTSAKKDEGCEELKQAIIDGIKWENIPWRSSPVLFKRLKDEIIGLKDEGRVLLRFNELREVLTFRMQGGENTKFTDAELRTVVGLLAGPGVVWELEFGSWILLQPERINAYAQAVVQTVREDELDRGCISEQRVLNGDLTYHCSADRLPKGEEQFVLLAMHQILVERGLCIRHQSESGEMLLMFPSYYRRERQEPSRTPAVQVSYTFNGFLDEIYATLVVKLHHTREFSHDNLWRNAADFKTRSSEKSLGLRLIRKPKGEGELQAFFAEDMPVADKIIFSKYIHEHLLQSGNDVRRFRHYVCPNDYLGNPCRTTANRDVAMERLEERGESAELRCQRCDAKLFLWDDLEELFADEDIRKRVQDLREAVKIKLDSESKERVLVGEVISTVALAGQICREKTVGDWGIDAEIEFKNDEGQATSKKVFLQLKSGDSFLTIRKNDGAAIFKSFNQRQAKYWMDHTEPVLLLIRNSMGQIQWMDIREELRRVTNNGEKQVRQVVFVGERFDVMSVRRWRDRALETNE